MTIHRLQRETNYKWRNTIRTWRRAWCGKVCPEHASWSDADVNCSDCLGNEEPVLSRKPAQQEKEDG